VATNLVNLKLLGITVAKITGFSDIPFQSADRTSLRRPVRPQIDEPSDDNTQTIGTPVGSALSNALSTLLGSTQLQVVALGGPLLTVSQKNSALTALTSKLSPVLAAWMIRSPTCSTRSASRSAAPTSRSSRSGP
jgi:hypothetical protein